MRMIKKYESFKKEDPTDFLGALEIEEGDKGLDVILRLHIYISSGEEYQLTVLKAPKI